MKKYVKFLQAIKSGDYRRAAWELINSTDYLTGDLGLKRRRLDAAIELNKLATQVENKKKK